MKIKKETLITIIVFIGLAVVGFGTGTLIKLTTTKSTLDYSQFDVEKVKPNYTEIMKKYESYSGNDYSNILTPAEMVDVGIYKYNNYENSYCYSTGSAITGMGLSLMEQCCYSYCIKDGATYFEENISKSIGSVLGVTVNLASRGIKKGDEIKMYHEASPEDVDFGYAIYDKTPEILNRKQYEDKFAVPFSEVISYIISNQTTKSSAVEKNEDGTYDVYLDLDTKFACYYYGVYMKAISNLDTVPNFDYVEMTFTLTEKLDLISYEVEESYQARKVAPANMLGNMVVEFFPNQKHEIPDLDTPLDYPII